MSLFSTLLLLVITFVLIFLGLAAREREQRGLTVAVRMICFTAAAVFGIMTAFVFWFLPA